MHPIYIQQTFPENFRDFELWNLQKTKLFKVIHFMHEADNNVYICLLYTSPSPRDS